MAPTYAGKVLIVTGASSGIGRALCEALAPQRPRLVMAANHWIYRWKVEPPRGN